MAFMNAPNPPQISLEDALKASGADAVYYGTQLRGVSNAKAKRDLSFQPRQKVAQEKLIQSAGIPYTILRATQFFEFIGTIIAQFPSDGQTVRVPSAFFQLILSDDVVSALIDITLGAPVNGIIDLAGPERFRFEEIIREFLSATQDTRQVVTDIHARYFGAKLDEQCLVPRGDSHIRGLA